LVPRDYNGGHRAAAVEMKTGEKLSILLVEDSPADAELARACLRNSRIALSVTWLRDGEEALDYVMRNSLPNDTRAPTPPDLILLDLDMPKMGGMDLVRRLKANKATRSIPIVVMTGSNEDHDIIESANLGTNGYIVKPLDFAAFMEAARHAGIESLTVQQERGPKKG
jgi:two-component system response regulator